MNFYWPPTSDPVQNASGALTDFAQAYGAGGELAQLIAQAYGYPGLTPAQAMDRVRQLLADGTMLVSGAATTGIVSRLVNAAVAAAGTAVHPGAVTRPVTATVTASGETGTLEGIVTRPVTATVTATGTVTGPSGPLPAGLALSASGKITGTPTGAETKFPVFTVTDSASRTAQKTLPITIIDNTPASGAFTEVQAGLGTPGGFGATTPWFSQTGGAASTAGTLLVARVVCDSAAAAVSAPTGWVLLADHASQDTGSGVARVQVWYYPANPGGIGGTSGNGPMFTAVPSTTVIKGELAEFSVPAGYTVHPDQVTTEDGTAGTAGAWARVQTAPFGTSSTATLPAASTPGNLLVAACCAANGPGTVISAPAGWVQVGTTTYNGTVNANSLWYYPKNPGGITTVTFTGPTSGHVAVAEYAVTEGSQAAAPSDSGTASAVSGSALTVATTGSGGIDGGGARAGDLVFAGFFEHLPAAGPMTWTPPAGFEDVAREEGNIINHIWAGDLLSAAADGVQTVTASSSVASASSSGWTGTVATFTAAGGGSPTTFRIAGSTPNTMTGGLAVAVWAERFSVSTPGGSWSGPAGWTPDADKDSVALSYFAASKTGISIDPVDVTAGYSPFTNEVGWAGAVVTFCAVTGG